jgi:sugar lactone lactonase YvrE
MDSGITASNGMGWSPDNQTMYYADTRVGVYAYDYDHTTGDIANRRLLLGDGIHPDGFSVDAEGFLWVAEPGSSCVRRYDQAGKLEREVRLPVSKPASCTFGGADLRTLFITTLRYRLSDSDIAHEPLAGGLFTADPGVRGLPEPRFAG